MQYDEYYRPIILNPYRDPVRIVYMYEMTPRIMIVPPLGRMVFEAAQYAAYSFTAACWPRSSRLPTSLKPCPTSRWAASSAVATTQVSGWLLRRPRRR